MGSFNKLSQPFQVYEFLKTTYAPTELDRFQDVVNRRNWLIKCERH